MEDLCTLPQLPSRTELIDASLVFASPQSVFHADVVDLLLDGVGVTGSARSWAPGT
ncbi:hypothetical protein ACFYN0_30045 [Streptomyces sp. NPDC006704]|uniref:hypothetical protein n=1 Tax=Streptomyces sp. NPDC006704 TaxID=3364760 RepID=UPI0036AFCDC9